MFVRECDGLCGVFLEKWRAWPATPARGLLGDLWMFNGATCALERLSMSSRSSTRSCVSEDIVIWGYRRRIAILLSRG